MNETNGKPKPLTRPGSRLKTLSMSKDRRSESKLKQMKNFTITKKSKKLKAFHSQTI